MSKKKITYIDTRQNPSHIVIDLKEVETMAALGMSQYEIAMIKGINADSFSKIKKREERIRQAIERGKAKDRSVLIGGVRKIAINGENDAAKTTAIKYLLNILHGVNEKHGIEGTMKHSGEITHNVSMDDFKKSMDDANEKEDKEKNDNG